MVSIYLGKKSLELLCGSSVTTYLLPLIRLPVGILLR